MFRKVVWATDGSDAADRALPLAKAAAIQSGAPLVVVYCEEFTMPGRGGGSVPVHANEDELRAKVEHQVADMAGNGITATLEATRSRVGCAARAIAEEYLRAETVLGALLDYVSGSESSRAAASHKPAQRSASGVAMPSACAISSAVRTSFAIRRSGNPSSNVSEMMNCLSLSSVVLFRPDETLRMSAMRAGSSPNLRPT